MIVINQPKLAILYDRVTIRSRYEHFQQVSLHAKALLK